MAKIKIWNGTQWVSIDADTVDGKHAGDMVLNLGSTPSIQSGLDASKPAAGNAGRVYIATDTCKIYRDSGTAWVMIGGTDTVDWSSITNKPASLPANGGNADTIDTYHAGTGANNVLKLDGSAKVPTGNLPVASAASLGAVKIGANVSVDGNGVISVAAIPASLPANGGNSDTVDNLHAASFLQYAGSSQNGYFDRTANSPTGTARLNYSGYFYATRTYNAVYNDYAEYFLKNEEMEYGDVVCKNPDGQGCIKSGRAYSRLVVGVVSGEYAQCIGGESDLTLEEQEEKYAPVGLCGRVSVKVTGKVKAGELLVSSNVPGVAMASKWYRPGTVIGKALEDYNRKEIGKIRMLIMSC